jgi:hypothetical protein
MVFSRPTTLSIFASFILSALAESPSGLCGASIAKDAHLEATLSTQPPTETGISTLPISAYLFHPFLTPTQSAIPGVFPSTDPKNPPPVQSDRKIVPDFAPAWAAAYKKAKAKVRL